jgi:hypothetical protein
MAQTACSKPTGRRNKDPERKRPTTLRSNQFITIHFRGLKRDVVYLDCPIAPSFMSPNAMVSANEYSCTQEPK